MKIALVTPYDYPYPGGVTEHIRHLDREFRARGHDTRIIAASTQPEGALASNVIRVADEVLPVQLNGSTARLALNPDVARRVEDILAAEQFDVIHLHEPAAPLLNWIVLHASRAVNVGTFHAYVDNPRLTGYMQPLLAGVSLGLDGRILVSQALRDNLAPYLLGDYRVIPNGIDVARFAGPQVAPIPEFADGRPNILFVGRLEPRKGFPVLLEAFPRVKRAVPEARLLVVGAFSEEEKAGLAGQIQAEGLNGVHLIGRVSPQDLARYYRTASVFAAPSLGGESFGIILLEAMAAGTPVVASRIPGYQSVVREGIEGILVPPADENALAAALTTLLRDPERRARLAANGRDAAAKYDWGLVAPRVLDYYTELLDIRPARRAYHIPFDIPGLPAGQPSYAEFAIPSTGGLKVDIKLKW